MTTRERITQALAAGPLSAYELADQLGAQVASIRACLYAMRRAGKVAPLRNTTPGTPCRFRLKGVA